MMDKALKVLLFIVVAAFALLVSTFFMSLSVMMWLEVFK